MKFLGAMLRSKVTVTVKYSELWVFNKLNCCVTGEIILLNLNLHFLFDLWNPKYSTHSMLELKRVTPLIFKTVKKNWKSLKTRWFSPWEETFLSKTSLFGYQPPHTAIENRFGVSVSIKNYFLHFVTYYERLGIT